ncbi:hypothetical protein IAR50_006605 [Cryptococcus sp. DSM 104548]
MSPADHDANPIDPSVEDNRSNPADDRSADADHDKNTEPESTPAPPQEEPEDPLLSMIPSNSCGRITFEKEAEMSGRQNSMTDAHYLELGTVNVNNEWVSVWNDAPGLKINSEWLASDMRTQLDMYMRRG